MVLPRTVSHYGVLEVIGRGGMGEVCRAVDQRLGRVVAIKFQAGDWREEDGRRQRFLNEGRALSSLNHPNIATIFEAGEAGGRPFLVREYLPGGTLRERVQRMALEGGVPPEAVALWSLWLARGLEHAHRHGVIHRDIKSSNAMFDEEGRLKLTDFGLASSPTGGESTRSSTISGTLGYLAPELLNGAPAAERSDLYSLGVTFYEMAAGHMPFEAETQGALLHRVLHEAPAPLGELRPDLPAGYDALVERLLAKSPGERPGTAQEVAAALAALTSAEIRTATLPPLPLRKGWTRREWGRAAGFAAAGTAAMGAAAVWLGEPVGRWLERASLPEQRYIAVLPFRNIGGGPEQQALCDGLMETLTTALSRRTRMQVAPPSEVRRIETAEAARREFGVNLVLTGSLQRRAEGWRLTLRLVDARTRRQLAAREVDSGPGLALQFEETILREVGRMLDTAFDAPTGLLYAGAAPSQGAWDLYLRGRGYLYRADRQGNVERAIAAFEEAGRADGRLPQAWSGLAEAWLAHYRQRKDPGSLEQVKRAAGQALRLQPSPADARVALGGALTDAGQYAEAEKELNLARVLGAVDPGVCRALARLYTLQDRVGDAENALRQAVAARPEDWRPYNSLGVFLVQAGRQREAEGPLRRVTELTPDNHLGYRNLGAAYLAMNRRRESERASRRAAELRPSAPAWSNLGALYLLERRYGEAAEALEQAVALMPAEAPREHRIAGNLGEAYRFSGAPKEKTGEAYGLAIRLAEAQLRGTRADAPVHSSLGLYHASAGDAASAKAHVEQALEAQGHLAEMRYQAAVVFAQVGETGRAVAELREALDRGYPWEVIRDAPLLEPVRRHPEFRRLAPGVPLQRR